MQTQTNKRSSNLMTIVSRDHREKIHNFIPEFRTCMFKENTLIEHKFETIGRQMPDMKQMVGEFRIYMSKLIDKEFNDGSNLAVGLNTIKTELTVDQMRECFSKCVPDHKILANELEKSTLNQIAGTEGWHNLVQKWIGILVSETRDNLIINYVTKYCEILKNQTIKSLHHAYKPCTDSAIDSIIINLEQKHFKLVNKIVKKITDQLDTIATQPYNSDDNYVRHYLIDSHLHPVQLVLEYIKKQSNLTQSLEIALNNTPKILEIVMIDDVYNNFYLAKAKNAHIQLLNFWKSKSVYIHNLVIEKVNKYRIQFKSLIEKQIQVVRDEDLVEPPHIDEQRKSLLNIYNKIEEINQLLN
jgi:hypothetical protein